jgi:hypothetical protein
VGTSPIAASLARTRDELPSSYRRSCPGNAIAGRVGCPSRSLEKQKPRERQPLKSSSSACLRASIDAPAGRWFLVGAATASRTYIPAVRQCDDTDADQSHRISDKGSNWSEGKQRHAGRRRVRERARTGLAEAIHEAFRARFRPDLITTTGRLRKISYRASAASDFSLSTSDFRVPASDLSRAAMRCRSVSR